MQITDKLVATFLLGTNSIAIGLVVGRLNIVCCMSSKFVQMNVKTYKVVSIASSSG